MLDVFKDIIMFISIPLLLVLLVMISIVILTGVVTIVPFTVSALKLKRRSKNIKAVVLPMLATQKSARARKAAELLRETEEFLSSTGSCEGLGAKFLVRWYQKSVRSHREKECALRLSILTSLSKAEDVNKELLYLCFRHFETVKGDRYHPVFEFSKNAEVLNHMNLVLQAYERLDRSGEFVGAIEDINEADRHPTERSVIKSLYWFFLLMPNDYKGDKLAPNVTRLKAIVAGRVHA